MRMISIETRHCWVVYRGGVLRGKAIAFGYSEGEIDNPGNYCEYVEEDGVWLVIGDDGGPVCVPNNRVAFTEDGAKAIYEARYANE